jgi:hypothetical protein
LLTKNRQVISICVIQCSQQRFVIKDTGILDSLWTLVEKEGKRKLSLAICEFLQACIYAKEYQYAYQQIMDTWPLPSQDFLPMMRYAATPVDILLRYYYLRGVVCMGCEQQCYPLAIRCFWTCLCVPTSSDANAVSAIAIAAWKKLVLLQSLSPIGIFHSTTTNVTAVNNKTEGAAAVTPSNVSSSINVPTVTIPICTNPLSTPKEMSWDLVRFLSQAKAPPDLRFLSTAVLSATPNSTEQVEPPANDDCTMHVVEADNSSKSNISSAVFGVDDEANSSNQRAVMDDRNHNVQTRSVTASTPCFYPSLGVYIYKQLVQAYISIDRRKFDEILEECVGLFRDDGNLGFVRRVGNALLYRQIYELSRIYASITLDELSVEMNLPTIQVHGLLTDMQTKSAWPVELISPASMESNKSAPIVVVFPPELPHPVLEPIYNDTTTIQSQLNELLCTVRQLDASVAASTKYNTAISAERRNMNTSTMLSLGPISVEEF